MYSGPTYIQDRSNASGMAFISPDYRLIPPSTGHEVVQDIQDLFKFLSENINVKLSAMKADFLIDSNAIAVTGSSAGGLCAYLAVMHANPKPKAVVALYAMGGNFLVSYLCRLVVATYQRPDTPLFQTKIRRLLSRKRGP